MGTRAVGAVAAVADVPFAPAAALLASEPDFPVDASCCSAALRPVA
jgi:hypothetical protein